MTLTPHGPRQELRQDPIVLIGNSREAKRMRDFAEEAAATDHTILLLGETGVGKDHLAELIHFIGRRNKSFVPVDCGALTESLTETELFGHTQGAFTDAHTVKPGLVQVAENGTLFFNEVANMSLGLQVKFLRILEKRSYRAIGGTKEIAVNTHIIAATNTDLKLAVSRGELREDLYQRLNGITFVVPPLRERSEDVPILAEHFLREDAYATKELGPDALAVMQRYHWPGNVRELKNAIVRAAFLSPRAGHIEAEHIHPYLEDVGEREMPTLSELQRKYFRDVLRKCRGNQKRAAKIAGISPRVMNYKLDRFQLREFVESLKKQ